MNSEDIFKQINEIRRLQQQLERNAKEIIDSDLDLETKWNIFLASDIGDIKFTTPSFVNDDIYGHNNGPIHAHRYEIVYAEQVMYNCEDMEEFDVDQFKRDCMKNMVKGWIFDW